MQTSKIDPQLKIKLIEQSLLCGFDAIGFAPGPTGDDFAFLGLPAPIGCFIVGLFKSHLATVDSSRSLKQGTGDTATFGTISVMACERDYHRYVKERLQRFAQWSDSHLPGKTLAVYTDSQCFNDKAIAVAAKLGHIGYNSLLIHPKLGSQLFIGYIATSLPLSYFESEAEKVPLPPLICERCGKCQKACPTGALHTPRTLDVPLCISYLTQKKAPLTEEESLAVKSHLFGCDYCQQTCPYNQHQQSLSNSVDQPLVIPPHISLDDLLRMNKSEFMATFGNTASGYLGINHMKRLAAYHLRHTDAIGHWLERIPQLLPLQTSDKVTQALLEAEAHLKARVKENGTPLFNHSST